MMTQMQEPQHRNRHFPKRFLFLGIALLLLISGVIVWILNITGLLMGPWSNILPVIFTALGAIIPLLQWFLPSPVEIGSEASLSPLVQQPLLSMQAHLGVSKRKGALIVKAKKALRGTTIHLYRGFDRDDLHPDMASNIILRKIDGSLTCIAFFAALEPGNYTISVYGEEQKTNVTIQAGQVAEIDWQCPQGKKSAASRRRWRLW